MTFLTYLDENEYKKKERALRKYFMKNYKYLIFKVYPKLKKENKKDGSYEITLPTNEIFKRVYGDLKLKFSVKDDIATIEDLEPGELLMNCFFRELPVYKGTPYNTKKDLKKIKMVEAILEEEKKWKQKG